MKNFLLLVLMVLLLLGCTRKPTEADKAAAEDAVKGFYAAIEKQDFDQMKTYCAPDFNGFEEGFVQSSDDFAQMLKSAGFTSIQIHLDFVRTDVSGDLGHCVVKFDVRFNSANARLHAKTFENYLLKKIDGKWLISFYQSAHLNGPGKLQMGSIVGLHVMSDIELKPGVTMAQVEEFMAKKFVPAFNDSIDGIQAVMLRGLRGEQKDEPGFIMYLGSDAVRNSIWGAEGVLTPKGQQLFGKIQPLIDERDQLFTFKKDHYTDWEITSAPF